MRKTIFYNDTSITLDKSGFKSIKRAFRTVRAGGGLVQNAKGEFLLIFRQGHWDLPKGKKDRGESIETCAIREVQEETGVSGLTIVKKLPKTYHLYVNTDGEIILKKCHWFEMKTSDQQPLKPQINEDITDAVWLSREEVEFRKHLMFPTIRQCFETYFATPKIGFLKQLIARFTR